jgi:hypothetical protein
MKNARFLITIPLLLSAISVCAQSQERSFATAKVPFAFTVQNTSLPAGTYVVSVLSPYNMIKVQSSDGRNGAMVTAIAARQSQDSAQGKLVFHRLGDHYFLAQVWEQGSKIHRDVLRGKLARELATKGGEMQFTTIIANASNAAR